MKINLKSDKAFMGPTHALSALAVFLIIAAFFENLMFDTLLQTTNPVVFIVACFICIGASLFPDFDAIKSTVISTLGVVGVLLSTSMRAFSRVVQTLIRGRSDDFDADPHRGFWHTIVSGLLLGGIIGGIASVRMVLPFTIGQKNITVGMLFTILLLFLSIQLTTSTLLNMKPQKMKLTTRLIVITLGVVASFGAILSLPDNISYYWVGTIFSCGYIVHLIGDTFTVAGAPLLFPFKHRGKRWWKYRMPITVKANSGAEYFVFGTLFSLMVIIAIIKIVYNII